ncbi:hypothetical protein LQW54_011899 [Pestalotiopsis sp. IQ-011]
MSLGHLLAGPSTAERGDEVKPTCGRCARKGIECVRPNKIRFKHWHQSKHVNDNNFRTSASGFRSAQPWVRTDGALQFIDESHHIPAIYADSPESLFEEDATAIPSSAIEPESSHAFSQPTNKARDGQYEADHQLYIPGVAAEGSGLMPDNGNSQSAPTIMAVDQVADAALQTHISLEIENEIFGRRSWEPCPSVPVQASDHERLYASPLSGSSDVPMPLIGSQNHSAHQATTSDPGPPFELPVFPLQDPTEAKLFRQWIEHGARRFDMCDAHRHFATVLPVRAMTCKPLVNALFALSAKFSADVDDYIAAEYYQRCLNSLVPMLDQPAALVNEDLFAAVVLLRSFEELEVPLYGAYGETHLLGSHLFIDASRTGPASDPSLLPDPSSLFNSFAFNGLRGAAFLVALRQELFIALVSQRPVLPAFSSLRFNRSLDVDGAPTADCAWANRIMPFAVDVLDFCYGENTTNNAQSVLRFDELAAYAERWFNAKPPTFDPVFIEEPSTARQDDGQADAPKNDRSIYPSIWLLNDAAATGLQNYYLIRILLSAFNPHMPRTGPTRTLFLKKENEEMRQHTRTLVGIARGNPMCVPLSVWAAVGIALAGDRFEDRAEQDELIRFLRDTQASSMWDTKSSRVHLAEAWGWDVDTIVIDRL